MRNWPVRKLGEVCEVVSGGTPDTNNQSYWTGDILWVTPKDLGSLKTVEISETERKITKEGLENSSAKLLPEGSVLLTTRAPIGHIAIAAKPIATNQGFKSFICKKGIYNKYLYYALKNFIKDLQWLGRGATFTEISKKIVEDFEIPVPGIEEQRRIVKKLEKILSRISDASSLRQELLEETRLILASAINQYFSKTNKGKEKLREVAILERGKFTPRPRNDPAYFGGSTPWIQIGEVTDRDGKYINSYSGTLNERGVAVSKVFPAGTAVVSIAASIGTVGILNFDSAFPDSLIGIQGKEVLNDYVYYYLQFMQSHLDYIAPQSAQKNINLRILGDLEIPVPDLKEQEKIVAYLDGLSEKVQALQKLQQEQLQDLEALQQSVLHQAFQGEL